MTDNEIFNKAVVKASELCKSGMQPDELRDAVCSTFADKASKSACIRMWYERDGIYVRLNCPTVAKEGGTIVFECHSSFGRTARDRQISDLKGQVDSMESELAKRKQQIADLKAKLDSPE